MLRELLFSGRTHTLLARTLDRAALSQRVIAANIANVGTPGYQRRGVKFEDELQRAMRPQANRLRRTHPDHIPMPDRLERVRPEVALVENGYWNGINNVNIDEEMVELAQNQLDFDTAAQFMQEEFAGLRTAIWGRR